MLGNFLAAKKQTDQRIGEGKENKLQLIKN